MKILLTLMLSCGMILSSSAEAKKVPPPAPNLAASVNLAMNGEISVTPPGQAIGTVNSSMAVTHSFTITPEQEAALQADTVIRIMNEDFTLGSDPNFQSGSKSAAFNGDFTNLFAPVKVSCTVTLKWNNGKMTVSVKGKLKEQNFTPENMQARVESASASTRSPYMFPLETIITYSSLPPLIVSAVLASDGEVSQTEGTKAGGEQYEVMTFTVKSRSFIYNN